MGIWDPAALLPLSLLLKPGRIDPSTWKYPELSKDAVTIPYLCPIQQGFVRTYTELPEWEKTSMRKERIETKIKRLIQQKYYLATIVAFPCRTGVKIPTEDSPERNLFSFPLSSFGSGQQS